MLESEAYMTYHAYATGEKTPKPKSTKKKADFESSPKTKLTHASKGKRIKTKAKGDKPPKKKQSVTKSKGLTMLSEVALTEVEQIKLATKRSLIQTHSSHASDSGTDEGIGSIPGVPDVLTYKSDDEQISWKSSEEEDDDEVNVSKDNDDYADNDDDADNQDDEILDDANQDDDNEQTNSDNDGDDFVHPKLSTHDDEARQDEEESDDESNENSDKEVQGANIKEEEMDKEATHKEDEANELYMHVNINLEGRDTVMTDAPLPNVQGTQATSLVDVPVTTIAEPPLLSATTLPPTPLITHLLETLETDFSEFKQTNQFTKAVSSIPGIVDAYLANKMHEAVKTVVQLQFERPRDEAQAENADFLNKLDDNIKKIIKDQVKEQVKAQTSLALAANLSELELKKILIDKMENNKLIHRSDEQKNLYKALVDAYESNKLIFNTYRDNVLFKRCRDDEDKDEEPFAGSNRGSKRRRARKEPESTSAPKEKTSKTSGKSYEGSKSKHKTASEYAQIEEPMHTTKDLEEPAHHEFETGRPTKLPSLDRDWNKTLLDAHGPVQPWLCSLAQKEDLRKSFNELLDTPLDFLAFVMNQLKLEYLFEEVYKATTEQLDWNNPEGQQYPHDLRNPLPLIPNSRGRHVIPFDHLINNDLEESARDVYSKCRIIVVTKLEIVDWHNYKHLDWITVRKDDDKLYKFKEGDFNRLHVQDIKDMLLLLVQGKRVEDLQLGVESYQKKLNLTKPNTYRPYLKRREAYTAYSNPRGFIYQKKDKKNRLIRIDELHKFSDGTLNDVRDALNDHLKGIQIEYLPQTIWRQSDKDKAGAMIQSIDKQLKTRRIIRSLEKFVGGRPYEGDFWLLQRTI
ncbi:hypothetical protein Tco_0872209 [Tanacetum coccineum]